MRTQELFLAVDLSKRGEAKVAAKPLLQYTMLTNFSHGTAETWSTNLKKTPPVSQKKEHSVDLAGKMKELNNTNGLFNTINDLAKFLKWPNSRISLKLIGTNGNGLIRRTTWLKRYGPVQQVRSNFSDLDHQSIQKFWTGAGKTGLGPDQFDLGYLQPLTYLLC